MKSAPEAPARPAPGEPGPEPSAVPSEPLHGPVDVAEDSLDGLQSAFRGFSVEEVVTQPVKRKREREKDAGDEADEGEDQGQDLTNDPTFEGAPSASGLHASPSPITTTLPIPDPAAATSTPITDPPMAEGTGFTGMPAYPAYGMGPPTTAFPEATTASEPVASSSAPRWYAADYHHPLPATGTYVDVPGYAPGYATLSGLRRGPESLGGRSRGSGRYSNRSLTRSQINEVLRGATSKIVGDLTQEIREKLEPLMIPPQASPTTVGMSPHRVQANHLAAGLTNTLGSLRSQRMPTPAAIPRSPFVPRPAQPPYSHVMNSTRAELDRLGLTALRAMVDVEPYGSSDLGGDPSDDEPPSMTSASPSEDDDPEDPENPRGKKKKKKKKTRRPEGRRSQEAKAIATSKIVVNLPEFTGKDLSEFAENFGRFLRLTGQTHASGRVKCDLLLQCCKTKYLEKQDRQIVTNSATFADVLVALERQYPTYETDLSIRAEIQNLPVLPNNPKPGRVSELLADLDHWAGRLTPGSYSSDDLLFWLVAKLPRELWDECRSTAERKARSLRYKDLCVLLLELALEKESDQHLNNYRPCGGGSGGHGKGYQGSRPGQGTTPKHAHARIMGNVKELFWCDARDEQGHLQHAPDCQQRDCFVVQGKQQEKNTGAKAKLPDHYRCTITCAFCGKRKHYDHECYHKQRLSAKLKGEDPGKGSGKSGGKGKGNDSGKGKSKGRGQGQDKGQDGRGGGANRQPDKDKKNKDKNEGNPNPNPGGNSEPSGGQSGPTTRSQTQAQQEQGAKPEHEGGDDGNAKKRSRFMRMARKLRNKGFEVTCPAEF